MTEKIIDTTTIRAKANEGKFDTSDIVPLCDALDELRAALDEALAQNERFNARYRNSEAEVERLRAALQARGPYCAQHGERQPCSQHNWIKPRESD